MNKIDELREIWRADPNFPRTETFRKIGLDESSGYKYIRQFKSEINLTTNIAKSKSKNRTNKTKFQPDGNLDDFRAKFDDSVVIPNLINEGVEKFLVDSEGDPSYMSDRKFREACGVPVGKWRRYADDFKYLQVSKDQQVWWGHPDIIEEMRKAVNR